uniref:DUF6881 domain-containing protein n=1 Tax=Streptomyces sp. NBC_00049 TaxID=2903617 RepID=A0AAU2JJE6_9ACTN
MEYWRVEWHHGFEDEPVVIYSEIGDDRYEVRRVQHHRDGRRLKADAAHESPEAGLGDIPFGPLEEVAVQPEFAASLVTRGEFEEVWAQADLGRAFGRNRAGSEGAGDRSAGSDQDPRGPGVRTRP